MRLSTRIRLPSITHPSKLACAFLASISDCMETNPNDRYSVAARRATVDTRTDPNGANKAMSPALLMSVGRLSTNSMLLIPLQRGVQRLPVGAGLTGLFSGVSLMMIRLSSNCVTSKKFLHCRPGSCYAPEGWRNETYGDPLDQRPASAQLNQCIHFVLWPSSSFLRRSAPRT